MEIYYRRDDREKLETLLQSCDLATSSLQQRAQILQYMLYCEMDEQVEKALLTYGFEGVSPKLLAKFITRHLQKDDSYDASWLALALHTFRKGKYTQEMLAYICRLIDEGGSRRRCRRSCRPPSGLTQMCCSFPNGSCSQQYLHRESAADKRKHMLTM